MLPLLVFLFIPPLVPPILSRLAFRVPTIVSFFVLPFFVIFPVILSLLLLAALSVLLPLFSVLPALPLILVFLRTSQRVDLHFSRVLPEDGFRWSYGWVRVSWVFERVFSGWGGTLLIFRGVIVCLVAQLLLFMFLHKTGGYFERCPSGHWAAPPSESWDPPHSERCEVPLSTVLLSDPVVSALVSLH